MSDVPDSHSLSSLLLYAQQFEDQHAPQNMTIALREAAKELDRLYAGGCARDQGTTQYCAEAASFAELFAGARDALAEVNAENERLRAALEEIASVKLYSFGLAHEDGAIVHEGEKEFMLRRDARAICDIARAALAQGGE
jgi:hypothetical protein